MRRNDGKPGDEVRQGESMKQPTSRILYNYWNDVRGDRLAPSRFEIEPSRIAPILSETFILERIGHRHFAFRLAGTRICEQFGSELRGRDFSWLAGGDGAILVKVMEAVTHEGGVGRLELEALTDEGRVAHFEMIVLPLVHPADEVTRYLGAISAIDGPAWLGETPLTPDSVVCHELIWPEGRPHAVVAQSQIPFSQALAAARIVRFDRRQFRVLDGGRKA